LLIGIKEWIIENMWDIRKVLEGKKKHAQHGENPSQFRIQESDFKSNLESRATMPSN
jgi:hypothetical protein